jgi:hypothetical protein
VNCPTPYKDSFASMGEARKVVESMQQRRHRGRKRSGTIGSPYHCQCGQVHLASTRRIKVLQH